MLFAALPPLHYMQYFRGGASEDEPDTHGPAHLYQACVHACGKAGWSEGVWEGSRLKDSSTSSSVAELVGC